MDLDAIKSKVKDRTDVKLREEILFAIPTLPGGTLENIPRESLINFVVRLRDLNQSANIIKTAVLYTEDIQKEIIELNEQLTKGAAAGKGAVSKDPSVKEKIVPPPGQMTMQDMMAMFMQKTEEDRKRYEARAEEDRKRSEAKA